MRVTDSFIIDTWVQESPSPAADGTTTAFTLTNTPHDATGVQVYVNGMKRVQTTEYTISGTTITFLTAPAAGQYIHAEYQKKT